MMTLFEPMSNGHPGRIIVTIHCIELAPDESQPEHCASYKARSRGREAEKSETDKLLKMKVIEPEETEWAAFIVLAPKKDGF